MVELINWALNISLSHYITEFGFVLWEILVVNNRFGIVVVGIVLSTKLSWKPRWVLIWIWNLKNSFQIHLSYLCFKLIQYLVLSFFSQNSSNFLLLELLAHMLLNLNTQVSCGQVQEGVVVNLNWVSIAHNYCISLLQITMKCFKFSLSLVFIFYFVLYLSLKCLLCFLLLPS